MFVIYLNRVDAKEGKSLIDEDKEKIAKEGEKGRKRKTIK